MYTLDENGKWVLGRRGFHKHQMGQPLAVLPSQVTSGGVSPARPQAEVGVTSQKACLCLDSL